MKHSTIVWVLLGIGAIFLIVHFSKGGAASAPGVVTAQDVANATTLNIQATQASNAAVNANISTAAAFLAQHDNNQFALDSTIANNSTGYQTAKLQASTAEDLANIQSSNAVQLAQINSTSLQSVAQIESAAQFTAGQQAIALGTVQANSALNQTQLQANAATNIAGKQQTSSIIHDIFGSIPLIGGLFK